MERLKALLKKWWLVLILGIVAVGLGIWVCTQVGAGLEIIKTLVMVYFLASGIAGAIAVFMHRKEIPAWGWDFAAELLMIALGIAIISFPGMPESIVLVLFDVGFIFAGVKLLTASIALKKYGAKGWGWVLALAILTIILGILLAINPVAAILSMNFMVAFAMISSGITMISTSIVMSKANSSLKMAEEQAAETYKAVKDAAKEYQKAQQNQQ